MRPIEVRALFRGSERVLMMQFVDGRWDVDVDKPIMPEDPQDLWCRPPSPPVAKLPVMKFEGHDLMIQAPEGRVTTLGVGALLACNVTVRNGWFVLPTGYLMTLAEDEILKVKLNRAEILNFPTHERGGRGGR